MLEIFDKDGVSIAANDDWRITQQQEIEATGAAPSEGSEAAIVMTLPDGDYTAVVRGPMAGQVSNRGGVFHLPSATAPSQLVNISTRGRVAAGDGALIAGIIINGDAGQRLMARAIGADLAAVGLRDALLDPVLDLRDASGNLIASNDNWKDTQQSEVEETGLIPTNDGNSAIIATLIPGLYTAVVRGKNDTPGLAVVEFYDLRRLLAPDTR